MKATIFFVSDDSEVIAKAKSYFESDLNSNFKIYSTVQWDQLLEDGQGRQTVHVGVPTLSFGLGHDGPAKVLQFAKPYGTNQFDTWKLNCA